MTWENVYVLLLALATVLLLALEKAHLSVLGVGLILAVAIPGLVTAEQAIAGFSNPALITIAALFAVGEGFLRTGAASMLAENVLQRTGRSEASVVLLTMVMSAALSAFVNNTLVVVTFMPVITTICRRTGLLPSRLLIPVSYASILGGMCTLVGTSTNLLVSGSLRDHGQEGLTMFQMSPAGLVLAGAGILYLGLVGRRLLPRVPSLSTQLGSGELREYVMEIHVGAGSKLIGQPAADVGKKAGGGAQTTMVVRDEALLWPPFDDLAVEEGDILMMTGPIGDLTQLQLAEAGGGEKDSYDPRSMSFFELAVAFGSPWVGRRVGDVELRSQSGAVVVALQRSGRHIRDRVTSMTLHAGDVLLAFGDDRSKAFLRQGTDFHLIEGVDSAIQITRKAPWAFGIILMVIALFVSNAVHYSTAVLAGALAMTLTGCLTVRQTQTAIKWPIILFIAGMLALSTALANTGTTERIAEWILALLPGHGEQGMFLLVGMLCVTVLLTEFLTNNAVAVLMVPIALEMARISHLDPAPLVMAVVFGASSCFANPIGYQTNLMVLGPGGYRFRHFVKVGLPLDALMIVVASVAIPWFWPLQAPAPRVGFVNDRGQQLEAPHHVATERDTALRLVVDLPDPAWVWVASYSNTTGSLALFPSEQLLTDLPPNPLPAGRHVLPGTIEGRELSWPVPRDPGITSYAIAISTELRPELDAFLDRCEQVGNSAMSDHSMGTYMPRAGRDAVPGRGQRLDGLLRDALDAIPRMPADRSTVPTAPGSGVWLRGLQLEVPQ